MQKVLTNIHILYALFKSFFLDCHIGALKFLNQEPTNTPPERLNVHS